MKKLMLLAAMMAMALVAAAPAFAQDQESGEASADIAIANELGNQCAQILNQQNTGNVQQDANVEQEQDVDQDNDGQVDVVQVQEALFTLEDLEAEQNADVNLEQTNENAQEAQIDQEAVEQIAAAEQNCEQALSIMQGGGTATATATAQSQGGGQQQQQQQQQQGGGQQGGGQQGGGQQGGGQQQSQARAQLPATGGASLFALGAGALLVTGGLVARRIIK